MTAWERIETPQGPILERFDGERPTDGVLFQVVRDEWDLESDPPKRTIHEVRLVSGSGMP